MFPQNKTLLSLTAADLMSESVVVVPEEMSLQGAAHLLTQARVAGAPVVDGEGRCVGVLSATDFVHWVDQTRGSGPARPTASVSFAWQIIDPEQLPADSVHNYMTRDAVFVQATTVVGDLARMMIDAHIHRLIVVDPERRPIGIVSSTDVLAAVARADELRRNQAATPAKVKEAMAC
jgi:CBS-domain-containing membrane protein